MRRAFTLFYILISAGALVYLLLPEPHFPADLPDSVRSQEPADLEDIYRIGFYTDMTRSEVISFYKNEFVSSPAGLRFPQLRLNYPPEEAQTLIRDQTQSTFLEELVHPGRESLFINGYKPKEDENPLVAEGRTWQQKIIIRFTRSWVLGRALIALAGLSLFYLLVIKISYQACLLAAKLRKR